jgi:hypothetical protein
MLDDLYIQTEMQARCPVTEYVSKILAYNSDVQKLVHAASADQVATSKYQY